MIQPLPARLDAATRSDELAWGIGILARNYPPYAERLKQALAEGGAPPLPEPDEWQFAVAVSKQFSNETYDALDRYRQVIDLLVSLLERGILGAALRPFNFGDPEPLPPGTWYNEVYFAWFATCRIDSSNPFSGRPVRGCGHWIMFEAEAFLAWETQVNRLKAQNSEAGVQNASEPPANTSEPVSSGPDNEPKSEVSPDVGAMPASAAKKCAEEMEGIRRSDPAQSKSEATHTISRRRGAKDRYPWSAGPFEEKVVALMMGNPKPRSLHHLADLMLEWCSIEWGKEPGKTTMRGRIAAVLARRGLELP